MVREVEDSRARVYDIKGNDMINLPEVVNEKLGELRVQLQGNQRHLVGPQTSAYMDEDYMLVASHVNRWTRQKIINREFVDFNKLLKKDRVSDDEGYQRMTMINKGGYSYWVPMTEKGTINGYTKWDQAFRVFLDIYTGKFPE